VTRILSVARVCQRQLGFLVIKGTALELTPWSRPAKLFVVESVWLSVPLLAHSMGDFEVKWAQRVWEILSPSGIDYRGKSQVGGLEAKPQNPVQIY